jgi:hypothetical protein
MLNLHKEFINFFRRLQIQERQGKRIKDSFQEVSECIKTHFKEHHPEFNVTFIPQGSSTMGTWIRDWDNSCDLDEGCYITPIPQNKSGKELQEWVWDAITCVTEDKKNIKEKCVRVFYKKYHIDIPVYRAEDKESIGKAELAVKSGGFESSAPFKMTEWFNEKKQGNPQLVRIICYMKAWNDFRKSNLPPGLACTILATQYQAKCRGNDGLALLQTLRNIQKQLDRHFECIVPVEPYDDIFSEYNETRIAACKHGLETFIQKLDECFNMRVKDRAIDGLAEIEEGFGCLFNPPKKKKSGE